MAAMPKEPTTKTARFFLLGSWAVLAAVVLPGCVPLPASELRTTGDVLAEQRAAATPPDPARADVGLTSLADPTPLPTFGPWQYEQFASHNRKPDRGLWNPGGKDFNNFIARYGGGRLLLFEDLDGPPPDTVNLGGYLLAAVDDGPGFVGRMWFTRFTLADVFSPRLLTGEGLGRFEQERLRIYVDDLRAPAVDVPLAAFGQTAPFNMPLAGPNSSAVLSYVPISFERRLRIVLADAQPLAGYFYHVNVQRTATPTRPFSVRLADDSTYDRAVATLTARTLPEIGRPRVVVDHLPVTLMPQISTTLFDHLGAGTVTTLRLRSTVSAAAAWRDVRLRITYDEAIDAAIDVPLSAFFGLHEAVAPFETLPLAVTIQNDELVATCRLPMPFRRNVHITLHHDGPSPVPLVVDVALADLLPPEPFGYLHARFHEVAGPQPRGSRHEVVTLVGRGRYVGTFAFGVGRPDERVTEISGALNLLEGNESGTIDGRRRIPGTGTEDYYNGGFYFGTGPFDHPLAACNHVAGGPADARGSFSAVRWHLLTDTIDFTDSFALNFEYGANHPRLVERYATVGYYYLDRP